MFSIPPGLVSGCAGDYSSFICVQPESVDRVRLKMGLLFYGDHWTQETIDHAVELFHRTNAEDRDVLVKMSKGLKSQSRQVGALSSSNFEGPLLDFYKYLDRKLSPVLGA
jgi:NDP-sugar pyrophosphorylase family protein